MKLHEAFDIVRGDVVAFVGAGGKTSTMVALGYELVDKGWRVLATTTTRIAQSQLELIPCTLPYTSEPQAISSALNAYQFVFVYDSIRDGKVYGPDKHWIRQLLDNADSDVLLVEADGARGLPFKAPYEHEPVIPAESTLVVPLVSLSAVGQPLDAQHVYNPQAMTDKFGFFPNSSIKSPWLAQVLRDEDMGLKGVDATQARVVAYINQTPQNGYLRGRARLIARLTLQAPRYAGVAIGSIRADEPVYEVQKRVGAIVLAAGMSTRMGAPKVLLPWGERETIIEHIVQQLIRSRVDPIVVVTGYRGDEVKALVKPLGAIVAHNRSYKRGEMLSSLKVGLRAMPDSTSAALIVLGDQPRLQLRVVYQVLNAYAEGAGQIVAPSYQMQRGHPILIARRYWPELLALGEGGAPRDVINAHEAEVAYVTVNTDSVLRDVDTPEDYQQERLRAGLSFRPPNSS